MKEIAKIINKYQSAKIHQAEGRGFCLVGINCLKDHLQSKTIKTIDKASLSNSRLDERSIKAKSTNRIVIFFKAIEGYFKNIFQYVKKIIWVRSFALVQGAG